MPYNIVMLLALSLSLSLSLSACAGMTPSFMASGSGMASYELQRGADGSCRVRISSGREVRTGLLTIGEDCTISASAETLSGAEAQIRTLEVLGAAVNRIPATNGQ